MKLYLFIYLTTTDTLPIYLTTIETLPIYLPNVCLLLKFHAIHGDVVPSGIWHIQHMETIGGTANVFFLQNDKLLTWHFHLFFIQSFFASRDKVTYLAQMPPSATIPIRHSKIQRNYLPGTTDTLPIYLTTTDTLPIYLTTIKTLPIYLTTSETLPMYLTLIYLFT